MFDQWGSVYKNLRYFKVAYNKSVLKLMGKHVFKVELNLHLIQLIKS